VISRKLEKADSIDYHLPSEGRGHRFESCRARQEINDLARVSRGLVQYLSNTQWRILLDRHGQKAAIGARRYGASESSVGRAGSRLRFRRRDQLNCPIRVRPAAIRAVMSGDKIDGCGMGCLAAFAAQAAE
jgi:hypothetical protein